MGCGRRTASRAASARSCADRRTRSTSGPALADWWPCRRTARARRDRGRCRRRAYAAASSVWRNFATCGWRPILGRSMRSSRPSTPNAAARSSNVCRRSPVASASSSARCVGRCASRKRSASVPSLQSSTSSRTRRRASAQVSMIELESRGRSDRRSAASRNATSKRTLWPTITASPMNSSRVGSTASTGGAGPTIASVMPVSTVIDLGIEAPGATSVWNVPETFTAAQLDRADLGDRTRLRRGSGGLEVDDAERHLVERATELVERALSGHRRLRRHRHAHSLPELVFDDQGPNTAATSLRPWPATAARHAETSLDSTSCRPGAPAPSTTTTWRARWRSRTSRSCPSPSTTCCAAGAAPVPRSKCWSRTRPREGRGVAKPPAMTSPPNTLPPNTLLRPALEAAMQVARAGESADPIERCAIRASPLSQLRRDFPRRRSRSPVA